jgi:predicted ribosomally synthesized peptide with nif11-like leader
MSKENLEQFMKQVADSEDLQAKIGEEITEDALVALGSAHGCEFSIEDVQAGAELSDAQMEGVAAGLSVGDKTWNEYGGFRVILKRGSQGKAGDSFSSRVFDSTGG